MQAAMQLWQLTEDMKFDGSGGLAKPGRWHTRARVLYCAETAAGALLEARVHLYAHPRRLPTGYRFARFVLPELSMEVLGEGDLPQNWWVHKRTTRRLGDEWLDRREAAALRVPSAILEHTCNVVLNLEHPALRELPSPDLTPHNFDARLFRSPARPTRARTV